MFTDTFVTQNKHTGTAYIDKPLMAINQIWCWLERVPTAIEHAAFDRTVHYARIQTHSVISTNGIQHSTSLPICPTWHANNKRIGHLRCSQGDS